MDRTKRNVAALGALTIIAVVVFFWGLYYLLGTSVIRGGMDVVIAMQNGGGLKRGDRVTYQGVIVGTVSDIELLGSRGVTATLRLNDKLPLPTDTHANITGDVFGAHAVELIPGTAMVKIEPGDTLRGSAAPALTEAASGLTESARTTLNRANDLLAPEAIQNLHVTAAALPATAEQLRLTLAELRFASAALRRSAEGLADANTGAALNATITRVDSSARAIGETARAVNTAAASLNTSIISLQSVFAKIDRGDGTLGRLVNDTSLYSELNGAARDMRALVGDIRANPKRYLTVEVF